MNEPGLQLVRAHSKSSEKENYMVAIVYFSEVKIRLISSITS